MLRISAAQKLLAVVPRSSIRLASNVTPTESSSSKLPRRIYNFPADQELVKRWKPQTPKDTIEDGMVLNLWGWNPKHPVRFFILFVTFLCLGVWTPFVMVHINTYRANKQ